ncbi:MAG TPA: putative porin [Herbaspirillum sp.]
MNDSIFPHKQAGAGKALPTPTPYTDIKLPRYSMRVLAVASALALLSTVGLAQAQTAAPSESAMVKLIRGLIQSGALKKDVGEALLAQAQTEAMATQQAQRLAASAPVAQAAPANNNGLHLEPGDVRVPYISDTVRDQIRDEVKGQVMAQAKTEGWAAPNAMPEWTQRIHIDGDMRFRNESHFYSGGNSNLQTDFNAINAGSGYDVNKNSNLSNPPLLNTNQNRTNQFKIRARIGLTADISDSTTAGVRLATGNDNNPVSTTQTLGGGLDKKNLWLDQAWLGYRVNENLKFVAGRFGNPFMSTDTLFSNDLNFDGVTAQFNKRLANKDVSVFGTLGVLPLEYSSDNSPATATDKTASQNKWLLALQVGADWKIDETNRLRGAAAYYDFRNITGRVSDSCTLYSNPTDGCNTDWSRPAFMQKGNTLMLLRDVALNPTQPGGPAFTPQPEYVGLASKFQLLDLNGRWDTKIMGGQYGLRLEGEYIRNLAYNANDMLTRSRGGIINTGVLNPDGSITVSSGPNAAMLQATLGKPDMRDKGDWNVLLGYKYIEPDALPDAYNDSTFNLGGTNARGYYIGGSYAIDKNTWINGRWLSSREIYNQALSIDVLQLELNARF